MKYSLFKKYSTESIIQNFVQHLDPIKHELIKYLLSGKQIKYDKTEKNLNKCLTRSLITFYNVCIR